MRSSSSAQPSMMFPSILAGMGPMMLSVHISVCIPSLSLQYQEHMIKQRHNGENGILSSDQYNIIHRTRTYDVSFHTNPSLLSTKVFSNIRMERSFWDFHQGTHENETKLLDLMIQSFFPQTFVRRRKKACCMCSGISLCRSCWRPCPPGYVVFLSSHFLLATCGLLRKTLTRIECSACAYLK